MLALPSIARGATCGEWAPDVTVVETEHLESKALTITWENTSTNKPPVACENSGGDDWEGTDHLELHMSVGSVVANPSACTTEKYGPDAPTAATLVASLALNADSVDILLHRSAKKYAFTLFACEDEVCSDRYFAEFLGDSDYDEDLSSDDELDEEAWDCTLREEWELTNISGETDVGDFVVGREQANAPHAFFYPASGWFSSSPDLSDHLVLYFHDTDPNGGSPPDIYYKLHNASGWPSGGFNGSSDWDTGSTLVAQGDHDTGDTGDAYPDYMADHVWSMLSEDRVGNHYVTLLAGTNPRDPDVKRSNIVWVQSTNEYGTDFDLDCSGGSCADDILEAAASGIAVQPLVSGTDTEYLKHARHGRVVWDYLGDPWLDVGEDTPDMLFTFEPPSSGDCAGSAPDDIAWATGAYDTGSSEWAWTVETLEDTGGHDCVEVHEEDGHDPGLIPLPGDEMKMYFKKNDLFYVGYWNGSDWVDASQINIWWEDSSDGPSHSCIGNVTTLVHRIGNDIHEGMFMRLQDTGICVEQHYGTDPCTMHTDVVGLDDDSCGGDPEDNDAAIVFAEHEQATER